MIDKPKWQSQGRPWWNVADEGNPATRLVADFGGCGHRHSTSQGHWRIVIDEADGRGNDKARGRLWSMGLTVESMTMLEAMLPSIYSHSVGIQNYLKVPTAERATMPEADHGRQAQMAEPRTALAECGRRGQRQSQQRGWQRTSADEANSRAHGKATGGA